MTRPGILQISVYFDTHVYQEFCSNAYRHIALEEVLPVQRSCVLRLNPQTGPLGTARGTRCPPELLSESDRSSHAGLIKRWTYPVGIWSMVRPSWIYPYPSSQDLLRLYACRQQGPGRRIGLLCYRYLEHCGHILYCMLIIFQQGQQLGNLKRCIPDRMHLGTCMGMPSGD